jgi:hypothetical protein
MITPKIKALFQFIEYLHSSIDNFNLNNNLIKELELLNEERQKVSSKKTFKDKLKYDEVQAEIETKFIILQGNTANLIKAKAKELNVCNFDNEPIYSFNGIETDIRQLKENFSKDDLPEIFKHKQQYIEYRTKTHKTFLSLAFFVDELDEVTKSLFDYFKEIEQNEYEAFETKAIQVNDIGEAVKFMSMGKVKVSVPINSKQPRNKLHFTTHEKLFEALIFSANEEQNAPIAGAYFLLKEVWFFLNSDSATFNGKEVEKYKRPLFVNPVIIGKPEFDKFFDAEITYCSTQNKINLKEQDFVTDLTNWIEKKSKKESLSIPRKRKFNEFLEYLKTKALPPQPISVNESRTKKVIFETITNIDKQGWQYAFVSEQDYNLFTDLLTNFFEYKPYTLPETIIQLKRTCKTKVAKALGEIHKELSNENKLSTDTKYFQLIRVLSHFEKKTEGDLYKALTR